MQEEAEKFQETRTEPFEKMFISNEGPLGNHVVYIVSNQVPKMDDWN